MKSLPGKKLTSPEDDINPGKSIALQKMKSLPAEAKTQRRTENLP
jgi:hypothetical protein